MFIRFIYHFFMIIWKFYTVFPCLFVLIVGMAFAISHIEKLPIGEALSFSFIAGLTIGYGDIVAKTPIARLISVFLGLIGVVFTGLMVAAAINVVSESKEG